MILQRIIRFLKDRKGISTSLVEAGAVISIGVALAAAFAPSAVKQATKGEDTGALSDVSSIKQMATSFQSDTGKFMAYHETGLDHLVSGDLIANNECPTYESGSVEDIGTCGNINDYLFDFYGALDANRVSDLYEDVGAPCGPRMGDDPWGRPYLVYINAFRPAGSGYGWVISAGENGVLETAISYDKLQGDDVGLVMEFRSKP